MKPLDPRLLAALLLLCFASASGAAVVVSPNDTVDTWSQSLGRPEGFTRMADGSLARHAGTADPVDAAGASKSGPRAAALQNRRAMADLRRDAAPVPVLKSAFIPAEKPSRRPFTLPLAAGMTAAAGVCLVLILGGGSAAEMEPAVAAVAPPAPAPFTATALPPRVADFLLDEPPSAAPLRAPATATRAPRLDEPFIDTRMPVGTWRAIARHEQALIERWNASPEKAAGRASFEQWLDRQGAVPGVDVPLLKAKLARA